MPSPVCTSNKIKYTVESGYLKLRSVEVNIWYDIAFKLIYPGFLEYQDITKSSTSRQLWLVWLVYGVLRHFQQYFRYIMAVNFIGGGKRSPQGKPPTCRK